MSATRPISLLVVATFAVATDGQVSVNARFLPPVSANGAAAIAVTLAPKDTTIVVNERPAPRLSLDPAQTVLVDKQPPRLSSGAPVDPSQARYLDPRIPVRFPVALAPSAPSGTHVVKGSVTFYYCSKSEGWCKKGTSEIAVDVTVP
jgi:hypothetical protein